jgi:hypothetical protein
LLACVFVCVCVCHCQSVCVRLYVYICVRASSPIGANGTVDGHLTNGDDDEDDEVEDDHDSERIPLTRKRLPVDGKRDADASLAVVVPF